MKSKKLLRQQIRERDYKTFRTDVINRQKVPFLPEYKVIATVANSFSLKQQRLDIGF